MEKLSTGPFRDAKKTERKVSKGKGKETRPGCFSIPLRPRACAKVGGELRSPRNHQQTRFALRDDCGGPGVSALPTRRLVSRYRLAGAAADELMAILGGNQDRDRGIWAYYCYHHDIGIVLDKAHEIASRHRQGELKNPVTAFQKWLQRSYGKETV